MLPLFRTVLEFKMETPGASTTNADIRYHEIHETCQAFLTIKLPRECFKLLSRVENRRKICVNDCFYALKVLSV